MSAHATEPDAPKCWRSECRNGCYYPHACSEPPQPNECCASGRCEVCTPGFVWGRDG